MTTPDTPAFAPSEIWTPTPEMHELDMPIQAALKEMNQQNPDELMARLRGSVEQAPNGVTFAMLKGENPEEYSDSDALVMFTPHAHAATPNMLVRGEFIREVAKQADVRDAAGKLKPVVLLASPGVGKAGSKLELTAEDRRMIRAGEFGPLSREYLQTVSEQDIGRVTLLGFSGGADLALAGGRTAYAANLDTHAVAIGDPPSVEDRTRPQLLKDFTATNSKDFTAVVEATQLDVLTKVLGKGIADFGHFAASAALKTNMDLYKGMTHDTFEARVQEILDEGVVDRLVVGYGANSQITRAAVIEPVLQQIHQRIYDEHGKHSSEAARFVSVRVNNAKHTWGDQLTMLAKLFMRAES